MKRILLSLFVVCAGLCSLNAANYFVKINGGGDGSSWNDAFSPAAAKTAIETAATGDTFFFAAGTYKFGSALTITSGIVVQGGYSMDAQGIETVIIYPSENITVFSGNNSHQVLLINSPSNKVTLKGVTVAEGKITSGSAAADSRPGVHVRPTSMLELYYCTITANQNTVVASAAAGGAGIYIETNNTNGGQVYAYKSVISNNISNNRGGGIRLGGNNVKLILEQCLVTGNSTDGGSSGNYGGGIQGSGTGTWMCLINTTVTGNSLSGKGGGGVATDGSLFLISSTIAGNITGDASEGTDLRLGNASSVFHSINSIVVGGESNAICVTPVNAMSNGFNILGSILSRSGGSLIAAQTDITNKTATQIFNTSSLNDNDGYPQTLKPVTLVAGATLAELEAFKTNFNLNIGDVSKDQRGNSRATEGRVCRGAYDDGTSFKDTVIIPDNIKYPLTQDTFIVWGNGYGENKLLRFPQKWQSIIPTENNIWQRVQYSAGMQIRFHTNASTLIVNCANSKYASNDWFGNAGANGVDLFMKIQDGKFYPCYSPTDKRVVASRYEFEIDPQDGYYTQNGYEYILYLPSTGVVSGLSIEINDGAQFKFIPVRQDKKPIVFYGTSIMNGIAASRAANNYTNIISRSFYERNIVNLGFSGTGRMESEVIAAINEIDADIYILDCMPNMQTSEYRPTIKPRAVAAVDSLMKHHPEARIILTEHCGYSNMKIYKNQRDAVNSANANLREAYNELLVRYPNNLYYITREELGLNMATDFADYIHPNDKGMYRYAEKYLEVLNSIE